VPREPWVIERVEPEATFALRRAVLDREPTADEGGAHFVVRHGSDVVATGTVRERERGWQVRGMAVVESMRGRGLGTAVLDAVLAHVADNGGGTVWCHARVAAVSLYERAGFVAVGEPRVDDVAGEQVHLQRIVAGRGLSP
jgi:GNAT superfamily N-acetyltransferase